MRKSLIALAMFLGLATPGLAQVLNLTVTNIPTPIVVDRDSKFVLIRENSATPNATFSITPAGSAVAQNLSPGQAFVFQPAVPFLSGQQIATITSTSAGPFTFAASEMATPPSGGAAGVSGNGLLALTVTNAVTQIVTDRYAPFVFVRENAAAPSAVFSITVSGTGVTQNFAAGQTFAFQPATPYLPGTLIGTITATAAGPFNFTGAETYSLPASGGASAGVSSGGLADPGSNGVVERTALNTTTALPLVGSDAGVPTAGTISTTTGTLACSDTNGGLTTNTCGNVPDFTPFPGVGASNAINVGTVGTTWGTGFTSKVNGSFGHVFYYVETTDNSANTYQIGIYNLVTGATVCSTAVTAGTTLFPALGLHEATFTSNCVLTIGGTYAFASAQITGTQTAKFAASSNIAGEGVTPFATAQISSSVFPSTITPPTLTYAVLSASNAPFFAFVP
jgi:hypothetical protein